MSDRTPKPSASIVTEPQTIQPSISTWADREFLVKEIVDELRRDALKEEVVRKLRKPDWWDRISKFLQHSAVLLIVGFVLTGWIGGRLTNAWQRREWDRQQLRLVELHMSELKYGIIDDLAKAVGGRNAAAKAILYPLLDTSDQRALKDEEVEPIRNWNRVTLDWLISSQMLETKIRVHIKNPEALRFLQQIIGKEQRITGKMANIKNEPGKFNDQETNKKTRDYLDGIYDDIYGTNDDLAKLTAIITAEVQVDLQGIRP